MRKVLVTAPVSKVKDYCMKEWLNHILNLTYENYEILLVDNSFENQYHRDLRKNYPEINVMYYNPKGLSTQDTIMVCNENARIYAVQNNFDYILSLHCDILPPLNCIEELIRAETDVACGFYSWGFKEDRKPLLQSSDFFKNHFATRNMQLDEAIMLADGKNHEVFSAGLGCALISGKVFHTVPFRNLPNTNLYHDAFFFMDCELSGFFVEVVTSMFCEHLDKQGFIADEKDKHNNVIQ
jgi:cellulose synthase/poly-beta-1,6-N-acetylglucosamine synthase-like glycosyltransferase